MSAVDTRAKIPPNSGTADSGNSDLGTFVHPVAGICVSCWSRQLLWSTRFGLRSAVRPRPRTLGVEVLDVTISSIMSDSRDGKALQAEARELLLKQADEAVYARRNPRSSSNAPSARTRFRRNWLWLRSSAGSGSSDGRRDRGRESTIRPGRHPRGQRTLRSRITRCRAASILAPVRELDWRTLLAVQGGNNSSMLVASAFEQLSQKRGADRPAQHHSRSAAVIDGQRGSTASPRSQVTALEVTGSLAWALSSFPGSRSSPARTRMKGLLKRAGRPRGCSVQLQAGPRRRRCAVGRHGRCCRRSGR